ncbi:hypothetical protein G7B40_012515 [Aetokthonos hydrillicola Thurmond2011]|jgi:hypothetical protein|uniref:Uncharacterized protein n=1 Tax=Aetokthonos hydrillicola Thurmond2011 TaxID=2712845 RepID=A0AAP5M7S4_9CYAN|nr:hypothetical protein [Aetokthonos hydrillicola]MBO3464305.1 hypothetical protein [Aetokthonos hydrillicola CCALA 1050]MBW4584838.1 hypothetical protein [Aetokthonos hydrillicola CCALA 1050]MDR9895385.1 hypothetical protein [Aetokthonos hydrillicola Thurmond2011]
MVTEEQILERWRKLTPQKQQQVLEFVEELQSQPEGVEPESEYTPQTPLAKQLWEIRNRAIASGMRLLNSEEIEQELAERRGGYLEA